MRETLNEKDGKIETKQKQSRKESEEWKNKWSKNKKVGINKQERWKEK